MPLTTTRPRTANRTATASLNPPSRFSPSAAMASPAKRSTRRAALRSAASWFSREISLVLRAGMMVSARTALSGPSPVRKAPQTRKSCQVFESDYGRRIRIEQGEKNLTAMGLKSWLSDSKPGHTAWLMGEYVAFTPAREVEFGASGQEVEAGLGQFHAAFALEHRIERVFQAMEIGDVIGRVSELLLRKIFRTPIRALLLLGEIDVEQLLHQILEAMLIGVGAGKLGRRARAIAGPGDDAEIAPDDGEIEARVMIELGDVSVFEQPFHIGRLIGVARELDEMGAAVAGRQLDQAETVATGTETQRFGVDGDRRPQIESVGKIAFVKADFHNLASASDCLTHWRKMAI